MATSIKNKELRARQSALDLEQEQLVGYWVAKHGLKARDLTRHPVIDDVILLANIRDVQWSKFNRSEQALWGAIWNLTYQLQRPIKNKNIIKLEQAIIDSERRHFRDLIKKAQQRQTIKARRNPCQIQRDDDIVAKTSLVDTSVPWEV
jgi:hypothetical protein